MTSKSTNAVIAKREHEIGAAYCYCRACELQREYEDMKRSAITSKWQWNDSDEHKAASICFIFAIALVILIAIY